jgi:hypothetical protein
LQCSETLLLAMDVHTDASGLSAMFRVTARNLDHSLWVLLLWGLVASMRERYVLFALDLVLLACRGVRKRTERLCWSSAETTVVRLVVQSLCRCWLEFPRILENICPYCSPFESCCGVLSLKMSRFLLALSTCKCPNGFGQNRSSIDVGVALTS